MATNQGYPENYNINPNGPSARLADLQNFGSNPLRTLLNSGGPLGIFGNLIGSQYEKAGAWQQEAEGTVDKQIADLGSFYKRESSTPFFQTEAGASALQQLKRVLSDTLVGQGNNAVTQGATQEAQLAGRGEATKQYGDAVSKLVGYGTDRNDQLARDYQYRLGQWLQAKLGMQQGRAQNYSTAAMNMINMPFQLGDSLINNASGLAGIAGGIPGM